MFNFWREVLINSHVTPVLLENQFFLFGNHNEEIPSTIIELAFSTTDSIFFKSKMSE